ncbi:MAG: ABC transporter ATP-binding protein [Clostridia bacterium]|nr:MAG: ABC transporter ATP-binding protein [Clostridia bacterium]
MIRVENLVKVYSTGAIRVEALRRLNLEVGRGEFVAIMGPSGSGKSTLMHILGCLDTPTSGRYFLDGEDVSQMEGNDLAAIRNRKIGFIFQSFNLLPRLTAVDNVELPLLYRGLPARERRRRAEALLEKLGLGDRLHHRPAELSGGQQQRVAIARALAGDPPLILADEPTGNLDSHSGLEVMQTLLEVHASGHTVVLITHDASVAAQAERIVRLRDGLAEEGQKEKGEGK